MEQSSPFYKGPPRGKPIIFLCDDEGMPQWNEQTKAWQPVETNDKDLTYAIAAAMLGKALTYDLRRTKSR